ncbi:MAG TPA: hypothetical protein ENL22_05860 [candidate division Zixibacteria bacterium]|nr:hypothetical protein [candidate division Zixibacteria bacterium]
MDRSKIRSSATETRAKTIGADSLCATCNHVAICVFCERANQPVIFCEEFEASDAPQIRLYGIGETTVEKPVEIDRTGLCVNCENIAECSYSKLNEEVLYCEEYV